MDFFKKLMYKDATTTAIELRDAVLSNYLVHVADFKNDVSVHDFYSHVADVTGTVLNADEDIATGQAKENRWIDISYDPKIPNRYRSSNTRQPLHTDDSYVELGDQEAVNFFYCTSRAKMGGATTFFQLESLVECMEIDGEKELLSEIMRTDVIHTKASLTKTRKIIDKDHEGYLANWNYFCLDREQNSLKTLEMCERFHRFLEDRVINSGLVMPIQLKPGEAVFFHDDRVLHGRNSFFVSHKGERCLIKGKIVLEPESI
jgi:alpha-ketoglutarate-dependent taurine dioxygenase